MIKKPHWEMTYDEIWKEFRDNRNYPIPELDKKRIHDKWKQLAAEVNIGGCK